MSTQYEQMWKYFGLDLTTHSALLVVLAKSYRDIR